MKNREIEELTANTHVGVGKYTKDGRLLFLSKSARDILGRAGEEIAEHGAPFGAEGIYPEDRPRFLAAMRRLETAAVDSVSCECRLNSRDAAPVWITLEAKWGEEDGQPVVYCFLTDVTRIEQENIQISHQKELLEKERQRFQIAVNSTPVVIFEYDVALDTYLSYGTLEEGEQKHNLEHTVSGMLARRLDTLVEQPYQELCHEALVGNVREAELRTVLFWGSSQYVWSRMTVTPIYGEDGSVIKTIGKLTNIQSEKEKEFALLEARSRDSLTGLYTREAGLYLVKEYMQSKSPDEICGMMLIDMDNFGRINREEGGVFADGVLQEVADILRAETGEDDIQIRLGGDEFMLFIKGCPKSRATVLGPSIAERIRGLFSKDNSDLQVSASIGMCVTEVVDEYYGLYRCAESTLEYVKEHCRGQAACYLDTSNALGIVLTELYRGEHQINEIDHTADSQADLISFALELLGKARNLNDAVFLLLTRIGKYFSLDRVSILDLDREYMSCQFSYQWARNPVDLLTGKTYYFSQEELDAAPAIYNEEGVGELVVGNSLPKMPSCLHAAIWDHGSFAGAMAFECRREHMWTAEERRVLPEMAKVISSFLLKARADAVSQAKTDFLSRMSHEIRTPMNAISGMTTIAKSVLDNREQLVDCLDKIETANSYLLMLINDILDMSRIESGKLEINPGPMDLGKLMRDLELLLRPQAEQKQLCMTVENSFHAGRKLLGDTLRLNQVLVNIVGNAVKFTNPMGSVAVRVEPLEQSERAVTLRFSVRDTGIGIPAEAQSRIFNAFEQAGKDTSSNYGGTGLGLSISSRLVQMMGGSLEVKSEVGKGSEFWFELEFPFAAEPAEPECAGEPKPKAEAALEGRRLLLAEDNALNLEIAQTILEMHGLVIETAVNGKEALDCFAGHPPGYYDGILMDIRMPVMDGLEATKRIRTLGRADSRSVPIIAMTANAFDEDSRKSLESGMDGHLSKPLQMDLLLSLLQSCIAKSDRAKM